MTPTIKVINGDQILRFRNTLDSYESLVKLVDDNIPNVPESYVLKYRDEEGDLCTVTAATFHDLAFLRSSQGKETDQVLRIYVTPLKRVDERHVTGWLKCRSTKPSGDPVTARLPTRVGLLHKCPCSDNCTCTLQSNCGDPRCVAFIKAKTMFKTSETQKAEDANQLGVHLTVICDSCNEGPISGVRFKCKVCDNYDLCGKCFEGPTDEVKTHVGGHEFAAMVPEESNDASREVDSEWTEVPSCCKKQSADSLPSAASRLRFRLEPIVDLLTTLGAISNRDATLQLLRNLNAEGIIAAIHQSQSSEEAKPTTEEERQ